MKSILFIVPTNTSGGTNSSLSSIINIIKSDFNVQVLVLNPQPVNSYEFLNNTLSSSFIHAYFGTFSYLCLRVKFLALLIKSLKRISLKISYDFESSLCRFAVHRLEKQFHFDTIVGFQEGDATKVASYFANPNKIAWLHCDYSRIVDLNDLNIYSKFKQVVAVSKFTQDSFLRCFPELHDKVIYQYNFLDTKRICRLSLESIEDKLFQKAEFNILSVGRMDPVKQFTLIPEIAKHLLDRGLKFKWYIIGGPRNNEYNRIVSQIEHYNVSDNVVLLGGKTNPYPYFKLSDVFVSTSKSEACPMVFNEARLCSIPVVTANFGSAYEFVNDGLDGYIRPVYEIGDVLYKIGTDRTLLNTLKLSSEKYKFPLIEDEIQKLLLTLCLR